jgi:hypothetical protein
MSRSLKTEDFLDGGPGFRGSPVPFSNNFANQQA